MSTSLARASLVLRSRPMVVASSVACEEEQKPPNPCTLFTVVRLGGYAKDAHS
ncbi:hypothetical protein [Streptomyces tuirus]